MATPTETTPAQVTKPINTAVPQKPATAPLAASPAGAPAAQTVAPVKPGAPKSEQWKSTLGAQQKLLEAEGKLKDLAPKAQQLDAIREKLKTDPLAALADLGIGYDELARAKVKALGVPAAGTPPVAPAGPDTKKIEDKLADVEKKLGETQAAQQTAEQQAKQQQWNGYVSTVDTAIKADAEAFPLVNLFGATPTVVNEILTNFDKTHQVMTPADAAKAVEERLQTELTAFGKTNPKGVAKLLHLLTVAVTPEETQASPRAPSGVKGRPGPARTLSGGLPPAVARVGATPAPVKPAAPSAAPSAAGPRRAPSGVRGAAEESLAEYRRRKGAEGQA